MYNSLQFRRRNVFAACCALLEATTMDPYAYRNHPYGFESSASAPSLRAHDPQPPSQPAQSTMSDDPGNVKVVVRCRAFVPRGLYTMPLLHCLD